MLPKKANSKKAKVKQQGEIQNEQIRKTVEV